MTKVEDLHRDKIHLTLDAGRYLMHNAMRKALGQPRSATGFEKLEPQFRRYLDQVLTQLDQNGRECSIHSVTS